MNNVSIKIQVAAQFTNRQNGDGGGTAMLPIVAQWMQTQLIVTLPDRRRIGITCSMKDIEFHFPNSTKEPR